MKELATIEKTGDFLLYTSPQGDIKIEVFFQNENIWLTQKKMAELFDVDRTVITKHLQNIFESKELNEASVSAKIAHTAEDGKVYQTHYYNLDAIISVGYRVNSARATQFRIWATQKLREFIDQLSILPRMIKEIDHCGSTYQNWILERKSIPF